MKDKIISLFKYSIIGKIILVFIVGTIVFISLVFMTTRYMFEKKITPKVNHNNINYTQLMLKEIGSLTDTTKAGIVADRRDMFIAIKNDTLLWKSQKDHNLVELSELKKNRKIENVWAGLYEGHHVVHKFDNTYIYFALERNREGFAYFEELILLINLTYFIIIIYIIFRLIKYILYPVNQLTKGVKKVSQGKFDYTIETKRSDELGALIHSFNDMRKQVSGMIKSKEQLLLDVSHEMRSPLTRMKLSLEFIENEKAKNNILDDVNDLNKMITELLETERLNSDYGGLSKAKMNLNQLLNELSIQYSNIKPGFKTILPLNETKIFADKERLRLLFKNLIENAIKYSENSKEPVTLSLSENKSNVEIIIEDKGEGIPEDQLEFIFEPFYRVDKSRSKESGGFGLGLHLCKNIVESHEGNISVTSKSGEGARFIISLPKN